MNTLQNSETLNLKKLARNYRQELLSNVIPFWESHSIDHSEGGYFTCLDRKGKVYDTDKFIWLQARQVYTFSKLYLEVEARSEWLEIAKHGAEFLIKNGRDENGDWYFSLDRFGVPLVNSYNIFSDCFAALAFGTLYKADPHTEYKDICLHTFERILQRQENPKKSFNKVHPRARKSQNFALPMIICNLSKELSHLIDKKVADQLARDIEHKLMYDFYIEDKNLILENVGIDGHFMDTFDGRLVNPGHAIEAMWFVMDQAHARGDQDMVKIALKRAIRMIEYGWDNQHGGIFYFLDAGGHPPQQLEWDQKLWWTHLEALVCLAKGIAYLDDSKCKMWFEKIHNYTWGNFKDNQYPEWFGYLNRQGEVLLNLKGGKWKGCFHVPRSLLLISQSLESTTSKSVK